MSMHASRVAEYEREAMAELERASRHEALAKQLAAAVKAERQMALESERRANTLFWEARRLKRLPEHADVARAERLKARGCLARDGKLLEVLSVHPAAGVGDLAVILRWTRAGVKQAMQRVFRAGFIVPSRDAGGRITAWRVADDPDRDFDPAAEQQQAGAASGALPELVRRDAG